MMAARAGGRLRAWGLNLAAALVGLMVFFVIAEIALRLLPVRSSLTPLPYSGAPGEIFRVQPNQRFTYSEGALMRRVLHSRVNNFGFASAQDYDSSAHTPLLAIVGDSYVEAVMTPQDSTMRSYLAAAAGPRGRVYAFGARGAPMAQYVAYADYARRTFRPDGLALVIIDNDYDGSLGRYDQVAGFCNYEDGADSALTLTCIPLREPWSKRALRHSALLRWLVLNAQVQYASAWLTGLLRLERNPVASSVGGPRQPGAADPDRLAWSRRAVDAFLRDLPARSGLPPSRILLLIDGMRPELYDPARLAGIQASYLAVMRQYLGDRATAAGFEVADLQPAFVARYALTHRRMEYGRDLHWNGEGHRVAADAVLASGLWTRIFATH